MPVDINCLSYLFEDAGCQPDAPGHPARGNVPTGPLLAMTIQ